jgi:UDP-N-acetylmuramoyl-tripeptide--D-alanyl-D-alanine ligase
VLAELAGSAGRIAVLGDMLELGLLEEEGHKRIGRLVADAAADALILLGKRAAYIGEGAREAGYPAGKIYYCLTHEEAAGRIRELAAAGDWILLKGSRGMRMEEILSALSASGREE